MSVSVKIEFTCEDDDIEWVIGQAVKKIRIQLTREEATVCTAPEWADQLRSQMGIVVGSISAKEDT
jgi:hypothetical protein